MSKFKVGDKVRITNGGQSHALYGFDNNSIATITSIDGRGYRYEVSNNASLGFCDEDNLELFDNNQGEKTMARRTFKLVKDLPDVKKGGLFQEECEDGTQPYTLITPEYYLGDDGDYECSYDDRKLVENAPQWFVEVFTVEPQYMTREELDRWEAFKKGKTAKTATVKSEVKTSSRVWTPERKAAQSKKLKAYWRKQRKAAQQ